LKAGKWCGTPSTSFVLEQKDGTSEIDKMTGKVIPIPVDNSLVTKYISPGPGVSKFQQMLLDVM
jgi:hypothetical protein